MESKLADWYFTIDWILLGIGWSFVNPSLPGLQENNKWNEISTRYALIGRPGITPTLLYSAHKDIYADFCLIILTDGILSLKCKMISRNLQFPGKLLIRCRTWEVKIIIHPDMGKEKFGVSGEKIIGKISYCALY